LKGDFSRVRYSPYDNFNGILPQQGKVLLDGDGIAQTLIENNWHETAARDVLGQGACVPAAVPDSFEISAASVAGGVVSLTVGTGHLWADGLLTRLESLTGNTVTRTATYLEPPLVPSAGSAGDVAAGTMDTVVLEVWQHAVSGFQMPEVLIEPALGGPDTAERLQTSFAFRLARLAAGQTCADVTYDESNRGALTVSLEPAVDTGGPCPAIGSGGYSGFEHQLYRIEIADVSAGAAQFKWSRINGGLVGRGTFDPATQTIAITANLPAIKGVNQTGFYLEIETYDAGLGYSHVTAGAQATLSGSTLQCTAAASFGAYPAASGEVFFRLWDGIEPVASFPISTTPAQLESGILLQFDPDGSGKYFSGDYWIFPVRAQGISNPQTLIDAKTPQGIVYYRVPLAEITWGASGGGFTAATIEDCRNVVPPLSRNRGCCTCRVGNGVDSFGDFTSIQAAIDSLPPEGGEVCVLPGRYFERVFIVGKRDIVIHGCGWESRVCSPLAAPIQVAAGGTSATPVNPITAVFTIANSQHIKLRSFVVEAADGDAGILVDGTGTSLSQNVTNKVHSAVIIRGTIDITIEEMVLTASTLPAILAETVRLLCIEHNRVAMKNVRSLWPAIFASGNEIHIEKNWVGIQTTATNREYLPAIVLSDLQSDAQNAAKASSGTPATGSTHAVMEPLIRNFVDAALLLSAITVAENPGGIQIGGPSTGVYVIENEIEGGSRNGITLGSLTILDANGDDTGQWTGVIIIDDGCCTGTITVGGDNPNDPGTMVVAGGLLTNIQIHRNRIRNMGLCGIGPVGFFDLKTEIEAISIVGLNISQNEISRTLLQNLAQMKAQTNALAGYGAVCVPDVQNLVICDNAITDFGGEPGAEVCGIFVLHGEMIEISRNQVLETRDWTNASESAAAGTGPRGGIVIALCTPTSFSQSAVYSLWAARNATPTYEPGLPSLRLEHNVVRVPLNYALEVLGIGPFSIVNNHLACGGMIRTTGTPIAQTVLILNLGTAIDAVSSASSPSSVYKMGEAAPTTYASGGFLEVSNGTVLFTNNICQLETSVSRQREYTSVFITTPDALVFSNNVCTLDTATLSALTDVLLVGHTVNVVSNRLQEPLNRVYFSGVTSGFLNVTGQNISTNCLIVLGTHKSNNNNLTLFSPSSAEVCTRRWEEVASKLSF
jgi:Family of unknown function (DUF6519)